MAHSNSSLNCFANCQRKYQHAYILHTPTCKPPSPHLAFGTMGHEVLYKAGKMRDEINDNIVPDYESIIPSELLYSELKEYFDISNWHNYFVPIIKQIAKYEKELIKEISVTGPLTIERELKLQQTVEELRNNGINVTQPLVGVIDLLLLTPTYATILDYKFSTSRKNQDDFDMNSQLQIYALLVNAIYHIPFENITIGYIDIPKKESVMPIVLSDGTLSRAKSQNVTQDMFKLAVIATHGADDPYYNCEPGGYYYDAYCNFAMNKPAYITTRALDIDTYIGVISDILHEMETIDKYEKYNLSYAAKYDSYSCNDCEYLTYCKPWLRPNKE